MIKDKNISDDAAIATHKILGSGMIGAGEIFYVGTKDTASYNWWRSRVLRGKLFTSLTSALASCVSARNDKIIVLPGFSDTILAAGGLDLNKTDVEIVGVGVGSKRPTYTLGTAATASITVTAANVKMSNFIFSAHLDNVATCFTVSAKDFNLENSEFRDESSSLHFLSCVLTDAVANSCDGLTVVDCKRFGLAAANTAFVSILESNDRVVLSRNVVVDAAATGDVGHFVILSDKNLTNAEIAYNKLILPAASAVAVGMFMTGSGTGQTGVVHNNYVHAIDTTSALFCTATLTFGLFENYQSGVVNASGLLWPAADTPS